MPSAALQLRVFRSTPYQQWKGASLLTRFQNTESQSAEPRVGVAIGTNGHATSIDVDALVHRLTAEPGIVSVSVTDQISPEHLRRLARRDNLTQLVVGSQSDKWMEGVSTSVLRRNKANGIAVRVLDLGRLCGGVHEREQGTVRALLLLLAAVARVRSADSPVLASIEAELRAVLGRSEQGLSPCVPLLACPAALDCLRVIGQLGMCYPTAAIPVEVPCHLNMDYLLTARTLELGAVAVVVLGCVPGCARSCRTRKRQTDHLNGRSLSPPRWDDQPQATATIFGLRGLVEALDTCLTKI